MSQAFICEGLRSPIGKFAGMLASVRPDTMLAEVIQSVMKSTPDLDPAAIDDVFIGCANQAGEDNRNVARMSVLLAGLPTSVPALTINRLCGSGLDAVGSAARAICSGEAEIVLAGGVESMSRAPFVMPKADTAYSRRAEIYDTTIGWRFVNEALKNTYGVDSMPETAENVAEDYNISREDQDAFALRSQQRAANAIASGRLAKEITPISIPQRKKEIVLFSIDEHPRLSPLEKLTALATPFRQNGTVTAGNASGVNDGAAAVIIASEAAVKKYNLSPRARITGMATAGVEPRVMGIGPAPASKKLLERQKLSVSDIDVIELNEAFAAQGLAVTRELGLADDSPVVNPNGGAIALGHPLGMSGTRLALTASIELQERQLTHALCTMCIGVGQGIALTMERA
ncbi:3-oxoadipyl-CoA thiolase [Chromatiales bacterium (ex Bugula neritina AB1)]|nr:3-oxoadipyl-CoA thiolase [Chromatiales bacterium (ex Bugula neritina AB1)]